MSKVRYLVGTGVQGFRPEGYKTIDIAADHGPDIVADAAHLPMIADGSADEFYASHVLEHFAWPRALLVLAEWARVLKPGGTLKVAVPDMEMYAHRLLNSDNPFSAMLGVYGAHWAGEGGPQGHHFGYTRRMLVQILMVMGFGSFDFWRSDIPAEAANTWYFGEAQERLGVSLNISCVKERAPLFDVPTLHHRIRYHEIDKPFMVLVRELLAEENRLSLLDEIDALLFQRINQKYLEAAHMAAHWESEYRKLLKEGA